MPTTGLDNFYHVTATLKEPVFPTKPAYTLVLTASAGYCKHTIRYYAYTIRNTTTHASYYAYTIRYCNYTTINTIV